MDKSKLLQLRKALLTFAEVATDKGTLTVDGELEVGVEVYIEDEPAADGEYVLEDGKVVVVAEGKVAEIKEPEQEPEQKPEEEPEQKPVEGEQEPEQNPGEQEPKDDEKVAELEAKIAELEALVAEKDAKIQELEDKIAALEKPVDDPLQMRAQAQPQPVKKSGALRYFEE